MRFQSFLGTSWKWFGLLLVWLGTSPAWAAIYVVNSTIDTPVTDGRCTLREAVILANQNASTNDCPRVANPGTNRIHFNIPGEGVHRIALQSRLDIERALFIDGLTQPGASCQQWPPTLAIEVNGAQTNFGEGLAFFGAPDSTVRGLIINGFQENGLFFLESHRARIQCNFIGTNADGSQAIPNGYGIFMANDQTDSFIGTDGDGQNDANEGNLISGNTHQNILLTGDIVSRTRVSGNLFGTDASGRSALPNPIGIIVLHAPDTVIGTNGDGVSDELEGNVFGGHTTEAIHVENDEPDRTIIAGNRIGTDLDGTGPLPNGVGIYVNGAIDDCRIGTNADGVSDSLETNWVVWNNEEGMRLTSGGQCTVQGNQILNNGGAGIVLAFPRATRIGTNGDGLRDEVESNRIAGNGRAGIIAFGNAGHWIAGNSIQDNGMLGLKLGLFDNEVTENDELDEDTGPNGLQNYPELTSVATSPSQTIVQGSLHSMPDGTFTLDFYASPTCDPSNHGEGAVWLGQLLGVQTDSEGNASFTATLSGTCQGF